MGVDEEWRCNECELQKSNTVSDDGLTHTFKVRDAKWSNGAGSVTAQDFVYAWQRIIKNVGNYAYMMGSDGARYYRC